MCIVRDPKGKAMVRYKGVNYCLETDKETAQLNIDNLNPPEMRKDFTIVDWN